MISLQTMFMRENTEKFYGILKKGKMYSAYEYVNHKTPSGQDRFLVTIEDNNEYDDENAALIEFKKRISEVDKSQDLFFEKQLI